MRGSVGTSGNGGPECRPRLQTPGDCRVEAVASEACFDKISPNGLGTGGRAKARKTDIPGSAEGGPFGIRFQRFGHAG